MNNPFEELMNELKEVKQLLRELQSPKTERYEPEKPVNVADAAAHVNLDEQTIYRMLRAEEIPAHKRASRWYFFKSELNDWIKNKTT